MSRPRSTHGRTESKHGRLEARSPSAPASIALPLAAPAAPVAADPLEVESRIFDHQDVTGFEEAGERLGATRRRRRSVVDAVATPPTGADRFEPAGAPDVECAHGAGRTAAARRRSEGTLGALRRVSRVRAPIS